MRLPNIYKLGSENDATLLAIRIVLAIEPAILLILVAFATVLVE